MRKVYLGGIALLLLLCTPSHAQTGPTYDLKEHTFNAGGVPTGGSDLSSAGYRLSVASIGDNAVALGVAGPSYSLDVSFVAAYPPPSEVLGLVFTSESDLFWSADPSAGSYQLYRGLMSDVMGSGYGQCEQQALTTTSTTDNDTVPVNDGYFYLVTVRNRLGEEGTKGFQSDMNERLGATCP